MSESEQSKRLREALELPTVRARQDKAAWDTVITAELLEASPVELLARVVGMADLAKVLIDQLAHHFEVTPETYLQTFAVFVAKHES